MTCIAVIGAGKSSSVLIDYLKSILETHDAQLIVADANGVLADEKAGNHSRTTAVQLDVYDNESRSAVIGKADIVISLVPPSLHILVAQDCLRLGKHLLTASYIDSSLAKLADEIKAKNLLFLCEMGLDPGIDHMSAMLLIHNIQQSGGTITSFKSHCGGLIAPESDDNPWHYKISWNPRNIINAGKGGASFKQNGYIVRKTYEELLDCRNELQIEDLGTYTWYANRDSLPYAELYGLAGADTFIRTTLRHPEFCTGWKNIVDLKLTEESVWYETDTLSIADFFKEHFERHGFAEWLDDILIKRLQTVKDKLADVSELMDTEDAIVEAGEPEDENVMMVNEEGNLDTVNLADEKNKAAEEAAAFLHEANVILSQLFFLGLDDDTIIGKGKCNAAEILQFILERKLMLQPNDTDMVVMLHEIDYQLKGEQKKQSSCLVLKGENSLQTAMAKTVGLPLGIAAKLLLEGKLTDRGLLLPVLPSIYNPVLKELADHGISFREAGEK